VVKDALPRYVREVERREGHEDAVELRYSSVRPELVEGLGNEWRWFDKLTTNG
jgi:hypothetical protein